MKFVYSMLDGCSMEFEVNCAVINGKFELSIKGLAGFKSHGNTLPEAMESLAIALRDTQAEPQNSRRLGVL